MSLVCDECKLLNNIDCQLINHPSIGDLLSGDDDSALQFLTHLTVEEFDDVKSGFKISLVRN